MELSAPWGRVHFSHVSGHKKQRRWRRQVFSVGDVMWPTSKSPTLTGWRQWVNPPSHKGRLRRVHGRYTVFLKKKKTLHLLPSVTEPTIPLTANAVCGVFVHGSLVFTALTCAAGSAASKSKYEVTVRAA